MHLKQLHLKNFRCFADRTLTFDNRIVFIEGLNGTGKTSLLEALHYLCYLRSFRTHSPRELLQTGQGTFFIKALFEGDLENTEIQAGFSGAKRLVKVNQKSICSYKELLDVYRVVTLTEDDLALIKEGPELRRIFIDQLILLHDHSYLAKLKQVRHIANNRNRLLMGRSITNHTLYMVLTQQLWQSSHEVQQMRRAALAQLATTASQLLTNHVDPNLKIALTYKSKYEHGESCQEFMDTHPTLLADEQRHGRSLFGAHLDDIVITFQDRHSKSFASRGQQKLMVLLLKIAQLQELVAKRGPTLFVLDDFMTDFDEQRVATMLSLLEHLNTQLIFTAPTNRNGLGDQLAARGGQRIILTH